MSDLLKHNSLAVGFFFGLMVGISCLLGCHTTTQIVEVPKVIEQKVIVKVPIKLTPNDTKQISCIANNISHEANNQPVTGKIAVANVVVNRTKDSRFGSTACSVITQKTNGVYQFSWLGNKTLRKQHIYSEENMKIAEQVYIGNIRDNTFGSLFYHTIHVYPKWHYAKTVRIKDHIFYREY